MTEWKICKLSDVVGLLSGFAYKSSDWQESGVPVLKITNVRNGRVGIDGCSFISKKLADQSRNFQVNNGDLLITLTGEIGATGFYAEDFEARLNQRVGKLVPNNQKEIDLKFVAYFLEAPQTREIMWATAKGIAQANISPKEVLGLDIPLPSIDEQHKIVELLEDHLSRLDSALADVKQAKIKASQFRRSLLQAAFTGNLYSNGTRLMTELPDGWEFKRLDEIADIVMGQSPPGSSYNKTGLGKPFFQGKTEFGEVHPTVRKYTTAGTKFAKTGDILMSVRAPVGPTNLADIDCVIGRGLAAIRGKSLVSQRYLRWVLKHLEIDIQSKGTGTTFDAITGETLRSTLVALPPIKEQHKIIELLEEILSRLDTSVSLADAMEKQSTSLRLSLLQAAFTGQLTKEVVSV